MKKFLYKSIPLLCVFALFSCVSYKKYDYVVIDSVKSLEGIYYNEKKVDSKDFDANDCSENLRSDKNDIFKIEFPTPEVLRLSFLSNTGRQFKSLYKGKYNRKKNTFDIWLSKQIIPLVILTRYYFEKARIGKNHKGNLVINNASDRFGIVIPLGGTRDKENYIKEYEPVTDFSLLPPIPFSLNRKWGYADIDGNKLIDARYDSITLFKNKVARVSINKKWALINYEGKELCPFMYKKIESSVDHMQVYSDDEKVGIIRTDGTETIPPVYDRIEFVEDQNTAISYHESLKGIITLNNIIFPPIFSEIFFDSKNKNILKKQLPAFISEVNFDGDIYAADSEGYLDYLDYGFSEIQIIHGSKIHYTNLIRHNHF